MKCPDCNKTEGNCTCHIDSIARCVDCGKVECICDDLRVQDSMRFKLNLYEQAPRGKVLMAIIGEHPMDKTKTMLMFGVEYEDDVVLGAGSTVCFLPKELNNEW